MALVVGGYSGCFKVTAFAEKVSTGEVRLFSIGASIPDKSLSLDTPSVMGRDKNEQDIFFCNGDYAATNTGEAIINVMDFDVTIGDDYAALINNLSNTQQRDVLKAIVEGGQFKDGKGDVWTVIGTNGQRWIGTRQPEIGNQRYTLLREGLLKHPNRKDENGEWALTRNGKVEAYNDTALVLFELKYRLSANKENGYMIPYAFNTSNTFNEGSGADINKHTLSFKRLCDVQTTDKFLNEGLSDAQTVTTDGTIYKLNVDYLASVAGGASAALPAATGKADGVLGAVVDTDDETVNFYVVDGETWVSQVVTGTLGVAAKIFGATTDGLGLITIGQSEKAVEIGNSYIIEFYEFDYATESFEKVTL